MDCLKSFLKLTDRIKKLTESGYDAPLTMARSLPDAGANSVKRLRISGDSGWDAVALTAEDEKSAKRAFSIIASEKRAAGEQEKRRLLLEYSRELEVIQAAIVQSAAAASIDIGIFARNLANEAKD